VIDEIIRTWEILYIFLLLVLLIRSLLTFNEDLIKVHKTESQGIVRENGVIRKYTQGILQNFLEN